MTIIFAIEISHTSITNYVSLDIDECVSESAKAYCGEEKCTNFEGSYECGGKL